MSRPLPKVIYLTFGFLCLSFLHVSYAAVFQLPAAGNSVIGQITKVYAEPGDTLSDIGERYDVGFMELVEANPHLEQEATLTPWTAITVPARYILPDAPRRGIVINLAELRMYYYPPGKNIVETIPVGIGREGWETPVGSTQITHKIKDPTWYPPKSVRKDALEHGIELPLAFPPGPENPLGRYALKLGWKGYLIHSTNEPEGVGRRSSAGCIRMFPHDAERFYEKIPVGTPVHVVNQAFKAGWQDGKLLLEAHIPLQEQQRDDGSDFAPVVETITEAIGQQVIQVDWKKVKQVVEQQAGIPQVIATP
ncbi:MAG: L,D-transpeptidase family protein [Gammaproteobacteria bacterium]